MIAKINLSPRASGATAADYKNQVGLYSRMYMYNLQAEEDPLITINLLPIVEQKTLGSRAYKITNSGERSITPVAFSPSAVQTRCTDNNISLYPQRGSSLLYSPFHFSLFSTAQALSSSLKSQELI